MFFRSREERTLDDFRRWKVLELKEFLRNCGLKTTGTTDELTVLVFGAEQLSVPVKQTAEGEIMQKKRNTKVFLTLPDNWIGEDKGVEKSPPILQIQIERN